VDVATRVLWDLPVRLTEERLVQALHEVVHGWRREVDNHLRHNALSESETERHSRGRGRDATKRFPERPALAYGATLLFAIVQSDIVAVGQLGDGDVLVVSAAGEVRRPLPPDRRLVAHATTSLCGGDPVGDTRLALLPADDVLVVLSTDGYANSFVDDAAFLQVGSDLLMTIGESGLDAIQSSLAQWLTETTRSGAGDDVSVTMALTGAWSPASASEQLPALPAARGGARRPASRPVRQGATAVPKRTASHPPRRRARPLPAGSRQPRDTPVGLSPEVVPASTPRGSWAERHLHTWQGRLLVPLSVFVVVVAAALGSHRLLTEPATPTGSAVAEAVVWAVSPDRLVVERRHGSQVQRLTLSSPVRVYYRVPGGFLIQLFDGRVGRLDDSELMHQPDWPPNDNVQLDDQSGRYCLVTRDGVCRWVVDPATGRVSPTPTEGTRPRPFP
jgi:hypothetical protein